MSQTGKAADNLVYDNLVYNERRNKECARFMTTANQSRDEWWAPADLFFLKHALQHGMTHAEVAGFLGAQQSAADEKTAIPVSRLIRLRKSPSRSFWHVPSYPASVF